VIRHEQSDHVLDLRNRCLDRRRVELASLSALLANADREIVAKAPQAAYTLVAPEACNDVDALAAAIPPPEQPDVAAKVTELRTRLAVASARQAIGKWRDGIALADAALADARAIGYPPVLAEALFLDGTLRRDLKDGRGAEAKLLELTVVAAQAKDDVLLARVWPELVFVVGFVQGRTAEGLAFEQPARSMLARVGGGDPRVRARLDNTVGVTHSKAGHHALAKRHQEAALAIQQAALGPDHPDVGMSLNNLAIVAKDEGRFADAIGFYDRAIAIRERALGPDHPYLATVLSGKATVSPLAESIALNDRVLAMQIRVLGPASQEVGVTLNNQAVNYGTINDYARQLELAERALAIKLAVSGPENPSTALSHLAVAQAYVGLGKCALAIPNLRRTIEIFERANASHLNIVRAEASWATCESAAKRFAEARAHVAHAIAVGEAVGKTSMEYAEALSSRATLALAEHQRDAAIRDFEHALAIREATAGKDAPDVAFALQELAAIHVSRDRPALALPLLERALVIQKIGGGPLGVAWCSLQLAKLLARSEPARARVLALEARKLYDQLPNSAAERAELTGWLASHPAP
jgi:eukaryotic-like serine/threonine-protein kinase